MSNDLAVQPAIVIFDKGRGEACGVAPVGVADPTFFAPITKVQREAGGVRGVVTNDAGEVIGRDGTPQGTGVLGSFGADLPASFTLGGNRVLSGTPASVKDAPYQAVGDGVTDDTVALQKALSAGGDIYIPEGTYITRPLFMVGDTVIHFHPKAVIKAKTGYAENDRVLTLSGINNVVIHGNGAEIQMLKAEYSTGENRHCVTMYGVENVTIYDLVTKDSGGDGFYIGYSPCINVALVHCVADNHWRNGLSITNGRNVLVLGGEYKNTGGYSLGPGAGIDIESNLADGYYLEDINIIGVRTSANRGCGILITPQSKYAPVSINVKDCTSVADGSVTYGKGAIAVTAAMAYTSSTPAGLIGKIEGVVNVVDCSVINPACSGLHSVNWTENAPVANIRNLYVLNPYSGGEGGAANRNKVGVLIRGETPSGGNYGTCVGNINIDGIKIEDTRATPLMYLPIYVETSDESTKPLKNLNIKGVRITSGQWTYASGVLPLAKAGTLAQTNVSIEYSGGFNYISSISTTALGSNHVGLTMVAATSSNFQLPDPSLYIGSTFHFADLNAGNFQVTPAAGTKILHYSPDAGVGIISRSPGSTMSVKAVSATEWQVVAATGAWAVRTGYEPRYPMTYDTAAPTTGTWTRGDIIWNYTPAVGSPVGWECVSAGTPGTWLPLWVVQGIVTRGDVAVTLTALTDAPTQVFSSALTADRAVTLSASGAGNNGAKFRVTRLASATGAFSLTVGSSTPKVLAAGQWCDVEYNGSSWLCTAAGSL